MQNAECRSRVNQGGGRRAEGGGQPGAENGGQRPENGAADFRPPGCGLRPPAWAHLADELADRLSRESVIRRNEPLAKHTTLRVGGPAEVYVEPAGEGDLALVLRFCRQHEVPLLVIGRGSNLLVQGSSRSPSKPGGTDWLDSNFLKVFLAAPEARCE